MAFFFADYLAVYVICSILSQNQSKMQLKSDAGLVLHSENKKNDLVAEV